MHSKFPIPRARSFDGDTHAKSTAWDEKTDKADKPAQSGVSGSASATAGAGLATPAKDKDKEKAHSSLSIIVSPSPAAATPAKKGKEAKDGEVSSFFAVRCSVFRARV